MKRHGNTLYVTSQGAYLSKEGEAIRVQVDEKPKLRIPVHNLEGIVCFGNVLCSPFLLGHCADRGVGVSFLTERGRFLARVEGAVSGNVLLRREQFRRADDDGHCAEVARFIVLAKTANCRAVLRRARRECLDEEAADELEEVIRELDRLIRATRRADNVATIRGLEGAAAKAYFSCFDRLILHQKNSFVFQSRTRRPPRDRVNAILSFVYTLLLHDIRSALEGVGLDPAVGYLHADRPGRPGLALDLMEELRPVRGDRLALTLINRQQLQPKHFEQKVGGAVLLNEKGRKVVLVAYQKRKAETIAHPFLEEKTTVGLVPHLQALLFARYLRGDLDGYPAFLVR